MTDFFGKIRTTLPNYNGNASFLQTHATDSCDFSGSEKLPTTENSATKNSVFNSLDNDSKSKPGTNPQNKLNPSMQQLSDDDLHSPQLDPYIEHLTEQLGDLINKFKTGINNAPQKADEVADYLINWKLKSFINPNPEPKPQFPINVESLTPKMKKKLLMLREYAQKELGVTILVNDAARTEEQQKLVKGGAKCSPHVQKIAVDIHIAGKTVEEAQPYLKKLAVYWKKITGGKGRWGGDWYGKDHDPWHYDLHTPICLCATNNNKKLSKV